MHNINRSQNFHIRMVCWISKHTINKHNVVKMSHAKYMLYYIEGMLTLKIVHYEGLLRTWAYLVHNEPRHE